MADAFHSFPKLSAELRLKIWWYALEEEENDIARIVEFHSYSPTNGTVNVKISAAYNRFFHVNREVRYEAIKYFPGELVPIHVEPKVHHEKTAQPSTQLCYTTAKVFINFTMDTILLSESFDHTPTDLWGLAAVKYRLTALSLTIPKDALLKLSRVILTCTLKSRLQRKLGTKPTSYSNALEVLNTGALKEVFLVLDDIDKWGDDERGFRVEKLETDLNKYWQDEQVPLVTPIGIMTKYEGFFRVLELGLYPKPMNPIFDLKGLLTAEDFGSNLDKLKRFLMKGKKKYKHMVLHDGHRRMELKSQNELEGTLREGTVCDFLGISDLGGDDCV